jgi:GNAT superfamily N-acetyltransferase
VEIEFTAHPTSEDLEKLTNNINYEAAIRGVTSKASPYAFFIREDDSEIIAGVNGSLIYGTIYIDQLWVNPAYRNQGYGLALMEKVHTLGIEMGCTMATVCTMDFQEVKRFYEKLGYLCDFERQGYAQDAVCYFLKKNL